MIFLSILLVVVVWLALGFRIVREDERAVVIFLGKPLWVVESGPRWTLWPFMYLRIFTTNLMELTFRRAGIVTKEKEFEGKKYGETNIGLDTSMYFYWPEGNDLLQTVKIVGNPKDLERLTKLFENAVLNSYRSVGGKLTYREILQDRDSFAKDVLKMLTDDPREDPIKQARLKDIQFVIDHLELPENLLNSITEPEIARIKFEAAKADAEAKKIHLIKEGEGNKSKIKSEGEGAAYARKKLFEAIGKEPENIQKETLLTLREMAKGTSNTILFGIPSQITDSFGNVFGGKGLGLEELRKIFPNFSDKEIINYLQGMIDKLKQ